ncbi:MAG: exodeoxyribonuclease V subunit gamma [Nitrospinae bacterium]|nr:exodeoxyribonuclease V subunit gamma [Nitrospinota bacterium]
MPIQELLVFPTVQRREEAISRQMRQGAGDTAGLLDSMVTFGQFETRLRRELLGPVRLANDFESALALSRALGGLRGAGSLLERAGEYPGFIEAALNLFGELGAGLVSPPQFEAVTGYAPEKERALAALYKSWKRELERRGLRAEGWVRRALIEAVDKDVRSRCATLERFSAIRTVDIYQFTPYRFELFRRLARVMPVTLVMPAPDNRRRAFGFVNYNLAKFEALGASAEGEGQLAVEFADPPKGPMAPFLDRLFTLTLEPEPVAVRHPVEVVACPSRYREVEEACADIHHRRKAGNRQWRDFALVFRDVRQYSVIVEDVFTRYGVPYFLKQGESLDRAPLGRAALSVFAVIESGYAREEVEAITGSSYFGRFAGIDRHEAARLYREAGIIEGAPAEWGRRLRARVMGLAGEEARRAGEIERLTVELLERLERLTRQTGAAAFFRSLASLYTWLSLEPYSALEGPRAELIRFRDYHAHAALVEIMAGALAAAQGHGGDAGGGCRALSRLFIAKARAHALPTPGARDMNRVLILNAHDCVGLSAARVYLLGLHEGEFPRRDPSRSLLTEEERQEFNRRRLDRLPMLDPALRAGWRVFDRAPDKWGEESLLFYQAAHAAREGLSLFYSARELNGNPLTRSIFAGDALEALLPGAAERAEALGYLRLAPSLAMQQDPARLIDEGERHARLLRDLFDPACVPADMEARLAAATRGPRGWNQFARLVRVAAVERARDRFFAEPSPAARRAMATRFDGMATGAKDELARALVIYRQGRYPPTALEKYGACPFRFFAETALGLAVPEEPELEQGARDAGTMLHLALERFYADRIARGALPLKDTDEERAALLAAARRTFAEFLDRGKLGDPLVWEARRAGVEAMLTRWLRHEAADQRATGYVPVAVETRFDFPWKKGVAEPYRLAMPCEGDRYLTGAADRIDINYSTAAVRVVDYKSGANAAKYGKLVKRENMGVTSFQPPVYMLLARNWIAQTGRLARVAHVTAAYRLLAAPEDGKPYAAVGEGRGALPVDDGVFLASGPGAEEREGTFESLARGVILEAEEGIFPVVPQSCEYCDFPSLCRYIAAPRTAEEE